MAGLFVAAFLCLLPSIRNALNIYDEGLIVLGAERVLNGQIPYRDFWTMYGPGQIYILAGLFKLFGVSLITERIYDLIVRSLLALALYLLAARLSTREFGILTWLMAVVWLAYFGFFGYPIFTALLFVTLSILALIQSFADQTNRRWLLGGGMLIGAATLFRHDLAAYAILAQFTILVAAAYVRAGATHHSLMARARNALHTQSAYIAGLAIVLIPAGTFLLATVPLVELLQQLVIFPLTVFPKYRVLPYPTFELTLESLPFYAPFLVYALTLVVIVVCARAANARVTNARVANAQTAGTGEADGEGHQHAIRARLWGIGLVALFGLIAFNQARVRADLIHIPQFFLPAVVLLPVLMRKIPGASDDLFAATGLAAFLLIATLIVKPVESFVNMMNGVLATPQGITHGIARAAGVQMSEEQAAAVRYVQFVVPAGQPIFSGISRHDRIFVNDPMFYFLADRPSTTRYHELHPGLATTAPVQQEIVTELEQRNVQCVVIATQFDRANEPNASAVSSGVTLLDDYIAEHFSLAQQVGGYRILIRR